MQYVLMAWSSDSDDVNFYYGSGTAERFQGSGTYNYWPSTVTDQGSTRQYSIYATVQPVWTITASAGANGGINPSGAVKVNDGSSQTFAITPNVGYHITDVTVDGVSQGAITSYTFTNVTADHTITASFAADEHALTVTVIGSGSVSKNPDQATYHYGDMVELTATPDAGWTFTGWSGGFTSTDNPATVIVNGSVSVTANFVQNEYVLTVDVVGSGSVSKNPDQATYHYGDMVELTATPDTGYSFSAWSGGATGSDNPVSVTIAGDTAVTATFTINQYTLTVVQGSDGIISPGTTVVDYGSSQIFTITANTGYHIVDVIVDGISRGAIASWSFTDIQENHTITATFAINTYTITVTQGDNGTISPGTTTVDYGSSQTFTITPDTGYHIADVLVDGESKGAIASWPFTNVQADHMITATYAIDTFIITVVQGDHGIIAPGTTVVNYGSSLGFTITPNVGYHITDVMVDGISIGVVSYFELASIQADHTITASFAINAYTITVTQGDHGTIAPGTTVVDYGDSQTFTITPDTGYHTEDVIVDGVSVGAVSSYAFTNVNGDHTITATFTETSLSDTTPPTICIDSPVNGETYCLNEIVIADWWVCDESGIYCSSATAPSGSAIYTGATGTFSFYVEAMDCAGNYNIVTVTYYIEDCSPPPPPDTTPPIIVLISPADGGIYCLNEVVFAEWAICDASGIACFSATAPSGSPVDTRTAGTFSFYVEAMDCAGNYNIVTVTYYVEEDPPSDTTPPTIVITIPEDGKTYALNEVVFADWFVTDEGSGVDESNTWGNVTSGSPIDTMILGINKFYVYAVDNAGNEASLTVFYNVVESSEIKSGDTAGPDPDLDPDDPTPPTPTYREPKPSPYVIQTRDNAASILSLLNGTSSVNATGHEGLDYNDDGVIDIADAFDQMCSAGILWAPAFKFDPGTASTFFDTLQVTYGPNLENFKPIDGRVWMLYVLTYLPYT